MVRLTILHNASEKFDFLEVVKTEQILEVFELNEGTVVKWEDNGGLHPDEIKRRINNV